MRVSISVPGTWHAFHLARQLAARDALEQIYTTYPISRVDTSGVEESRVNSIKYPEAVMQLGARVPVIDSLLSAITGWESPTERLKGELFDRAVARKLREERTDIFVGFAGVSNRSINVANAQGATTIVERCSSHIRTQAQLLAEEYQRQGVNRTPISEAHIEREEEEYAAADFIVVPSTFVYQSFIEQGVPEGKVLLEPYAVDIDQFSESGADNYQFTESGGDNSITRYLFAGGVGLRKGIPDLLSAWSNAGLDNAELLIAGSIKPEVSSLASKYEDDKSVRFLGWCDDIQNLYRSCDAFVFPSIEEGSAYVTYEAMASGLPVITTPNSGWVGQHEEHGLEIEIRSPGQLADALRRFHRNLNDREDWGKSARELIEDDYTWDRYGERIYKRYTNIV